MKSLKPFLLVLAGVLITVAIFSFKSEEPKKEYALLTSIGSIVVYFPDDTHKTWEYKANTYGQVYNKVINELAKEGWNVSSQSTGGLHLARTKQ